jgi:hypothetical protein
MIEATVYRNKNGNIYGFKVTDHSESIVCSAVSMLVLNTSNSIEKFVPDAHMISEYDENGGYFKIILPQIKDGIYIHDADLLFKSLLLGLEGVKEMYEDEINIIYEEVQ